MLSSIKFQDGMLVAQAGFSHDGDKDGKAVVNAEIKLMIDPLEAMNEIAQANDQGLLSKAAAMIQAALDKLAGKSEQA